MTGLIILFVVIAIVGTAVRVSVARGLARRTGVDEGAATAAALFGDGAITSMYLQAHRHDDQSAEDDGHVVANLSPDLRRDIGEA